MTDRELLERAAKAAGLAEFQYINNRPAYRFQRTGMQDWKPWNPLTDDGDALRLAVKLQLSIHTCDAAESMSSWACSAEPMYVDESESHGDDPYAATRRAIVRAAAAIG